MKKVIEINNKKLIIVGTAHISQKSKEQVKKTIEEERPEIVGIELDKQRFYSIMSKDRREIKFTDIFKARRPGVFFVQYFLAKYQKKIAGQFNISPGAEMIQAINSAKEIDAKILLADRDVNITLSRLLKSLNFRDKWKIFFSGFKIKKELGDDLDINKILSEVEKEDEENTQINKIMDIFMKEHKKIKKILIDERDLFICYHIQKVLEDPNVNTIVLVVGAGHMPGIIKNIENKNINIKELLVIKKVKLNS